MAVVAAGLAVGCSADADETTAETGVDQAAGDQTGTDGSGSEFVDGESAGGDSGAGDESTVPDGDLTFRDPEDEGFAPVDDNDVEPESAPEIDTSDLSTPDELIPEISEQLADGPTTDELLDSVDVLDGAGEVAVDPDGQSRNASGELARLDDEANLACAHSEIAVGQLDAGQVSIAMERIATAAHHADASGEPTVRAWVEPLESVIADGAIADLAPLVGFLSACTERGYEL